MYITIPLKQGLKRICFAVQNICEVHYYSIKTRIETLSYKYFEALHRYITIPLKQGLKQLLLVPTGYILDVHYYSIKTRIRVYATNGFIEKWKEMGHSIRVG